MIFESSQAPLTETLEALETQTIWSWLFESRFSDLSNAKHANGFRDGDSGERLSYKQVESYATRISTTFARDYHIKPGNKIMIICENSIWYPVVMFAGLRIGNILPTHPSDHV